MLTSGHGGAIVTGRRDEYLGVVTVQTVMEHIQQVREEAAEVSG
jgi:osmoprotectant transport system ATP-binding protein